MAEQEFLLRGVPAAGNCSATIRQSPRYRRSSLLRTETLFITEAQRSQSVAESIHACLSFSFSRRDFLSLTDSHKVFLKFYFRFCFVSTNFAFVQHVGEGFRTEEFSVNLCGLRVSVMNRGCITEEPQ
jgi:hypothetical protein